MNAPRKKFRLGTRKSLLAWAQSSWVAREIERLNPGVSVELHGIETRGDKILDVSLRSIEGKEFFVAELDHALRSGEVDLTVHSLKDLSLDRPAELRLGAIPKRENPRDAILFGPLGLERIRRGKPIRIGTSSPRRLENIPPFLDRALPMGEEGRSRIEFVEIRGNVNTRLSRVHEQAEHPKQLDGVVLALAGLIRLFTDRVSGGNTELSRLLQGARWMIMPLRECPTAPGQGALAVECRADDATMLSALSPLHHDRTAHAVARERGILAEWGGGCHQKFGATVSDASKLGEILQIRGRKPDESFVDEMHWMRPAQPQGVIRPWNGLEWRESNTDRLAPSQLPGAPAWFVSHSRAVSPEVAKQLGQSRVWTSGSASWFRLADLGVWVEGSGEGLGFEDLLPTLDEPVLGLPSWKNWRVLTHLSARGWETDQVISTYQVESHLKPEALAALESATHVYWGSGSQLDAIKGDLPEGAHHACGPGKTSDALQAKGLAHDVFPSVEEWKRWLGI